MNLVDLLCRVSDAFERNKIDFILLGGMGVSVWSEPRLTKDCDIVVRVRKSSQSTLKAALVDAGARVTALEMRLLFGRPFMRLQINGTKLDVHRCLSPHDRAAFENSVGVQFEGRTVRVASAEDLVLYKLQAWRPQDRLDITKLLADVKGVKRAYIESWLDPIRSATNHPMWDRWTDAIRGS